MDDKILIHGENLTINNVVMIARKGIRIALSDADVVTKKIQATYSYIEEAVSKNKAIYGVTTGFGGMSNVVISQQEAIALQNNIPWPHTSGAGRRLPNADVRAAMVLRTNSLMRGLSGVRLELVKRLEIFLNSGITPHVYELGSIGASGDLVPLSHIAGALVGIAERYKVDFRGDDIDCITALKHVGLEPMQLAPKEGLALINGTSMMSGIAANCMYDSWSLLGLTIGAHGLMIQGLGGSNQPFHPFIHKHKPHTGQVWAADQMLKFLSGSQLIRDELDGLHNHRGHKLIQDRYSLRCLPQYLGPIIDGFANIAQQIETEINSATDNPLIDPVNNVSYHCGNFLGQYIGTGMDLLRYFIGLMAKHLDAQISLLVSPEFNDGLAASLVGNTQRRVNLGLKGLQLTGNSIMPILTFLGNSLVDRYPTHAEQFNQNINSQGFGSANLARQSVEICQQYLAIALMFGVQAVDLRTYVTKGHYDARAALSPASAELYESLRRTIGRPPSTERPYIWDDDEQGLDEHIALIAADIVEGGEIPKAVGEIVKSLESHPNCAFEGTVYNEITN